MMVREKYRLKGSVIFPPFLSACEVASCIASVNLSVMILKIQEIQNYHGNEYSQTAEIIPLLFDIMY